MWNHQENERNWKHLIVQTVLLKVLKTAKNGFVKSTCLKGDLEEKCWVFVYFSLTSTGIAGVHHFPRTGFKILAPMQLRECKKQFLVLSKEEEHHKCKGGSTRVKTCVVIPILWLSLDTGQCTWIKTAFFTVLSNLIESLSRLNGVELLHRLMACSLCPVVHEQRVKPKQFKY